MIRDFIKEDKTEILKMVSEFYNSPAVSHPISTDNFSHCFDEIIKGNPLVRGLTVLHEGEILGYCQLSFTYSSEADGMVVLIEEIYIKPEFQGKGVAPQIFDFLEKEYEGKAARYRLECCSTNVHALGLYAKRGFEVLDYIQMIKE
ncbi:MAG: GNAT family N-acetyltransferase [Oscillospiraceae bacterium]